MQKPIKTTTKTSPVVTTPVHHPVRTLFAALFGTLAVLLILSSLVSVWLNRTLTNTNTFVSVVAPLASTPSIQNFAAQKVSEELLKNAPTQDLANALLPPTSVTGQTPEQLKAQLQPVLYKSVQQLVANPGFAELWKNTNQTAHSQLISQLNSNSSELNLDLHPVVVGLAGQLKDTQLASVSSQLPIDQNTGKLNLRGSGIDQAHISYRRLQQGTIATVVLALLFAGLAILISTHHSKTLRRILIAVGVVCLLLAAAIQIPSLITIPVKDFATQKAIVAIIQKLFHNLQVASLVLGLGCIGVAGISKLVNIITTKHLK